VLNSIHNRGLQLDGVNRFEFPTLLEALILILEPLIRDNNIQWVVEGEILHLKNN
jgi:hypothetical protein